MKLRRFLRNQWPVLAVIALALSLIIPTIQTTITDQQTPESAFGKIPILHGGRIKPWDSYARETLLSLHGKQKLNDDNASLSASQWLIAVFTDASEANSWNVFRIDHADIKAMIRAENGNEKYYSYDDLFPHLATIDTQARLSNPDPSTRDSFQKATIGLHGKLVIYQNLLEQFQPKFSSSESQDAYSSIVKQWIKSIHDSDPIPLILPNVLKRELSSTKSESSPDIIPSSTSSLSWNTLSESWISSETDSDQRSFLLAYLHLISNWKTTSPEVTMTNLNSLRDSLTSILPPSIVRKLSVEYSFNQIQPFILSIELYLLTFMVVLAAWIFISKKSLSTAFWLLLFTFIIHTTAMIVRMWLMDRPPVTNLYSSAVFVGWGTVALGLLLEVIFKQGISTSMAAITGLLSLIIAQHLMEMGDTMEMMRAVLDSNFWLTTHVITVTFGYSATFLAGFVAIAFLAISIGTTRMTEQLKQTMIRMVYGTVCFALLFSFIGTFLGGIWADQSWGRFWGWDPKENGALLIVVWNAVILHAKHSDQIAVVGMMQCAIFGNMVTAWSWFGTNMLGQGLHSYGFMESAMWWLFAFWATQAIIILSGYLPKKLWRSKTLTKSTD